jgi:hypothetical protein
MSVTCAPASEGSLRRKARRGVNTVTFEVPGGRPDEVPVIPQRLLSGKSRDKDGAEWSADKKKLAGFGFCRAGDAQDHRVSAKPSFSLVKAVLAH